MPRGRVLAISQDLEKLKRLVTILEAAGAEVDVADSLSGPEIPHRYVFFAWDGEAEPFAQLLAHVRPKAHVSAIVPNASLAMLTRLLADPRCNHVMAHDDDAALRVTAQKLLTGDIFGIEKYLPESTAVRCFRLRDFQGRGVALDTILSFAKESGIRRKVRAAIGQVCEELLMNALYDAPVDELGQQIFAEVDPHRRTGTKSPRPVSIRYAATEHQFAVAVRDRFGRLAKDTILAYINKCLHSAQQIDRKTYGAGLGLYLVAHGAAGFIVNVAYGMATEVVCTFDRTAKAPLRLVGVFVHPGLPAPPAQTPEGSW